jgi:hypothetical protein
MHDFVKIPAVTRRISRAGQEVEMMLFLYHLDHEMLSRELPHFVTNTIIDTFI